MNVKFISGKSEVVIESEVSTKIGSYNYYKDNYIATVSVADGKLVFLGGNKENNMLKRAKMESDFCYAKIIDTNSDVKLILDDGIWVAENNLK